jgi:hypothetical protein
MNHANKICKALAKADQGKRESIQAVYSGEAPYDHEALQKCIKEYNPDDTVTITRAQFLEAFSKYHNLDIKRDHGTNAEWEKIIRDEFSKTLGNWIFDGMRKLVQP